MTSGVESKLRINVDKKNPHEGGFQKNEINQNQEHYRIVTPCFVYADSMMK
jgi:hypothetical protein